MPFNIRKEMARNIDVFRGVADHVLMQIRCCWNRSGGEAWVGRFNRLAGGSAICLIKLQRLDAGVTCRDHLPGHVAGAIYRGKLQGQITEASCRSELQLDGPGWLLGRQRRWGGGCRCSQGRRSRPLCLGIPTNVPVRIPQAPVPCSSRKA